MSESDKDDLIFRLYYMLEQAVAAVADNDNSLLDLDDAQLLLEESKPVVESMQ